MGHGSLVDVFEVLERHGQHLVVECTVITEVLKHFPRLHEATCSAQCIKVGACLDQGERWVLS